MSLFVCHFDVKEKLKKKTQIRNTRWRWTAQLAERRTSDRRVRTSIGVPEAQIFVACWSQYN